MLSVEADASVCAMWVFLLYSFIIRADWAEEAWGSRLTSEIYPKADILNRFIAKFVDAILVMAAGKLLSPAGWLAGLAYVLVCDGFSGGRSIGKRLTGLQTVNVRTQTVAGFKESIIRNLPLASAYLLFSVPYIGWVVAGVIAAFEALLILGNEQGLRVGDEIAHTQVLQSGQLDVRE
jgi:hypothetical protein